MYRSCLVAKAFHFALSMNKVIDKEDVAYGSALLLAESKAVPLTYWKKSAAQSYKRRRLDTNEMHSTALRLLQARSASTAGRLLFDRDYHIHLGGAIAPSLIASWVHEGKLTLNDAISDLVAAPTPSRHPPSITVRRAFEDSQ